MIADYGSKHTKPAVRTMATKMKSDQNHELSELESELGRKQPDRESSLTVEELMHSA